MGRLITISMILLTLVLICETSSVLSIDTAKNIEIILNK
jgi:hypothetical protein